MSKLKLTLMVSMLVLPLVTVGQTIGDDLEYVSLEREGGETRTYFDGFTYEYYDQASDLTWLYLFGTDSICDYIAIHPESHTAEDGFLGFLNDEMERLSQNLWHFKRPDGELLSVTMKTSERTGTVFVIAQRD